MVRLHAAAVRRVAQARAAADPEVLSNDRLPEARHSRTLSADGVSLRVCEYGDLDAEVTVVMAHGWTLSSALWRGQIRDLSEVARVVVYDHRGHGRSERAAADSCTLDQLGLDLGAVVDSAAPRGPVILVGHSMGGMAIMHLAAQRPELVRERVAGVALLSTSAGELSGVDLGLPAPLAAVVRLLGRPGMSALGRTERWLEAGRPTPAEMWLLLRRLNFGPGAPARLVDEMAAVVAATPVGVVSSFYAALLAHDGAAGLLALADTPSVILVGEHDALTPVEHARRLARALPQARLTVVPDAGHMVTLEGPDEVSLCLRGLVRQASLSWGLTVAPATSTSRGIGDTEHTCL